MLLLDRALLPNIRIQRFDFLKVPVTSNECELPLISYCSDPNVVIGNWSALLSQMAFQTTECVSCLGIAWQHRNNSREGLGPFQIVPDPHRVIGPVKQFSQHCAGQEQLHFG